MKLNWQRRMKARLVMLGIGSVVVGCGLAHGQMACSNITPKTLTDNLLPESTKEGGPGCRFVTKATYHHQASPGTLDILPSESTVASEEEFNQRLNQERAKGKRCSLELNLGQRAAWCIDNALPPAYDLLILRGRTVSALRFRNWPSPPNPSKTGALELANVVFGPAAEEKPLTAPKD